MAKGQRRLRPTRAELVDAGAVLALLAIAIVGFRASFGGARFMVVGMVAVALGVLVGHLAMRLKLPVLVTVAAVAVLYLLLCGVVALPERATSGVVPNGDTVRAAARTAVFGWKELITTNPPVGRTGTLMVLPFLCGYAGAVISLALMRSRKLYALAIVPPAIVLCVGIVTGLKAPVAPVLQGGVFAAVAIGWLAVRHERNREHLPGHKFNPVRFGTAIAMLAVCTAAGWFVSPSLPRASATDRTVWRQTVTPPFDPRQYPSPLSGYRYYVKDKVAKDAVMFTVQGLPAGVKIRLSTMDTYDGLVWRPSYRDDQPSTQNSGYFERMGSDIPSDFGGEIATIIVTIQSYNDVWVPDVGEVLSLRFEGGPRDVQLNEQLRYNRATDTAASRIALQKGDRYVMTVRLPPSLDTLAKAPIMPDAYVGPASAVPASLGKWASSQSVLTVKDLGTRIDVLRDRMVKNGSYSDGDRSANQAPSDPGHSAFRMNSFVSIEPMRGNAEQYASALALMLRGLSNIPTRVVMGFEPDAADFTGSDPIISVTGRQVEAWVEVPIEDLGWVAVVPTPERDETALKAKSPSPPQPEYETQVPPPPPVLDPDFDSPATSKTGAKDTRKPDEDKPEKQDSPTSPAASGPGGAVSLVAVTAVGSPLVVGATVVAVILVLKLLRRRRRRRRGLPHERMANGWREVTDRALDMGRPIPDTATRREAAQFVGTATVALAVRADAAVFAAGEPSDDEVQQFWEELERELGALSRQLGLIDRMKAAVSVTSLRRSRSDHRRGSR